MNFNVVISDILNVKIIIQLVYHEYQFIGVVMRCRVLKIYPD